MAAMALPVATFFSRSLAAFCSCQQVSSCASHAALGLWSSYQLGDGIGHSVGNRHGIFNSEGKTFYVGAHPMEALGVLRNEMPLSCILSC